MLEEDVRFLASRFRYAAKHHEIHDARAYWTALKELGEQVRFEDPSGQGLLPLLDLHARIEEELKPDYLLIDTRAGVTELGSLAITLLSDTVVCMFAANRESLDGTLVVAEAVRMAPRLKGQRRVRIAPVLARTASALPTEGSFAEGVERLLKLAEESDSGGEKKPRKLFVLPHDEKYDAADRITGSDTAGACLDLFQELF
jgi:hypothetical protein